MKTFGQLYAARRHLGPEQVERDLFLRCLYPHARLLHGLVTLVAPDHFAADRELIREMLRLTDPAESRFEIKAHRHKPAAGGVLRRRFCLRLSTRRLRRLVWATFRPAAPVFASFENPVAVASSCRPQCAAAIAVGH